MILVDTSAWIDFLKGVDSRERWALHSLIEQEKRISLTGLILTEVLQGVKSDQVLRKVQQYLLEFPVYNPGGIETYLKGAEIYRTCRRKGTTIRKTADCIIAAVCIENELRLLHKDRDFEFIEACTPLMTLKV